MERGPQRKWLHKIEKEETQECHCKNLEQSGRHAVAECAKLAGVRKVLGAELEGWETRHLRSRRKEKGDVGMGKRKRENREKEEREKAEKLAGFFGTIHEFLSNFKSFEDNNSSFVPSSIPFIVIDDDDEDVDTSSFVAFPSCLPLFPMLLLMAMMMMIIILFLLLILFFLLLFLLLLHHLDNCQRCGCTFYFFYLVLRD